jgi:glycerol-3-phosphate dehydrogenase
LSRDEAAALDEFVSTLTGVKEKGEAVTEQA